MKTILPCAILSDRAGRLASLLQKIRPALQTASARIRPLRPAVQVALIILCLIPVGLRAAQDWGAVRLLIGQIQAPAVFAACLALILASLFLPTAMTAFTRGAARRIGYRHSALAYFGSQPMKYLPGNFWILPGRVVLLRGLGHDVSLSSAALLFEMNTQVLSASLVVALLMGLTGFTSAGYQEATWLTGAAVAGSLAVSLLLLVSPTLAQRLLPHGSSLRHTLAQLAEIPLASCLRNLLRATLLYAAMWMLMGVSFYALMVATNPHLDVALLKVAIGVSTLSWLAGFLTPFSPGGVGVRESAIMLLLSPFMDGPQALMVALLSRAVALGIELAFFAGVWLPLRAASAKNLSETCSGPVFAKHPRGADRALARSETGQSRFFG